MFLIHTTEDGSKTLYSERFGEHYHSMYGAAGESEHVFIRTGYQATDVNPVSVLEIGFGTGLNAYLTLLQAESSRRMTYYEAVELYPVDLPTAGRLSEQEAFISLHTSDWDRETVISPYFTLHKRRVDLSLAVFRHAFDVIYFDAFSPAVQPGMWTREIFSGLYEIMNTHAVMTTYCAKGAVRRTLQSVGFAVERLPGPKGKREILRARKT